MPYKGYSSVSIHDSIYKEMQLYLEKNQGVLSKRRVTKISHLFEDAWRLYRDPYLPSGKVSYHEFDDPDEYKSALTNELLSAKRQARIYISKPVMHLGEAYVEDVARSFTSLLSAKPRPLINMLMTKVDCDVFQHFFIAHESEKEFQNINLNEFEARYLDQSVKTREPSLDIYDGNLIAYIVLDSGCVLTSLDNNWPVYFTRGAYLRITDKEWVKDRIRHFNQIYQKSQQASIFSATEAGKKVSEFNLKVEALPSGTRSKSEIGRND